MSVSCIVMLGFKFWPCFQLQHAAIEDRARQRWCLGALILTWRTQIELQALFFFWPGSVLAISSISGSNQQMEDPLPFDFQIRKMKRKNLKRKSFHHVGAGMQPHAVMALLWYVLMGSWPVFHGHLQLLFGTGSMVLPIIWDNLIRCYLTPKWETIML